MITRCDFSQWRIKLNRLKNLEDQIELKKN